MNRNSRLRGVFGRKGVASWRTRRRKLAVMREQGRRVKENRHSGWYIYKEEVMAEEKASVRRARKCGREDGIWKGLGV